MRPLVLGVALLIGANPARAQTCMSGLTAALGPGADICTEVTGTSSSASLWAMPGLASRPNAYAAFLDAIVMIPQAEGLRGWATTEARARVVSPWFGRVALVGESGLVGVARMNVPAEALDYFRSDSLADSLYWSFEGVNVLGATFRSVGGGALLEPSAGLTVGATFRYLEAGNLLGGRVSGGVLESFDGLDVDMQVTEYGHVRGSGTTFGFFAVLTRDEFQAALTVEHLGAPLRLTAQNHVREADSTYGSTGDAVTALRSPKRPTNETVEIEWPARVSFAVGHEVGRRTWLWVDSDVVLASDFGGANGIGARLQVVPVPWMQLEAGGGWRSGVDASMGVGVSAGRLTWKLHGRSALNGRNMRIATGFALH